MARPLSSASCADSRAERTPGCVDGDGDFDEGVFAGLDGRVELFGAEAWRRGEDDDVDVGFHHFPVGIEAGEAILRIDLHFVGGLLAEEGEAGLDLVVEEVGHGGQFDVRIGLKGVGRGAGTASATADEAETKRVVIGSCRDGGGCSEV